MVVSAGLIGCGGGSVGRTVNPPEPVVATPPEPPAPPKPPDPKEIAPPHANPPPQYVYMNPHDAGLQVYKAWQGPDCIVYPPDPPGASPRPPGQMPAPKTVACPPIMNDPIWEECRSGTIRKHTDDGTCSCMVNGNPPPPVKTLASCPKG